MVEKLVSEFLYYQRKEVEAALSEQFEDARFYLNMKWAVINLAEKKGYVNRVLALIDKEKNFS